MALRVRISVIDSTFTGTRLRLKMNVNLSELQQVLFCHYRFGESNFAALNGTKHECNVLSSISSTNKYVTAQTSTKRCATIDAHSAKRPRGRTENLTGFPSFNVRLAMHQIGAWPAKFAQTKKNGKNNMTEVRLASNFLQRGQRQTNDNKYTEGKVGVYFWNAPICLLLAARPPYSKVEDCGSESERFPRVSIRRSSATRHRLLDLPPLSLCSTLVLAGSFHAPRDPNWTFSSHRGGPENEKQIPTFQREVAPMHIFLGYVCVVRGKYSLSGEDGVLILKIWSHRWTSRHDPRNFLLTHRVTTLSLSVELSYTFMNGAIIERLKINP